MKIMRHAKCNIYAVAFAVGTFAAVLVYTGTVSEAEYLKVYKKNISVDKGCNISVKYKASSKVIIKSKNRKVATARIKRKFIVITGKNVGRVKVKIRCKKLTRSINVLVTGKKKSFSSNYAVSDNTSASIQADESKVPVSTCEKPSNSLASEAEYTPVPSPGPTELPDKTQTPGPTNLPDETQTPGPTELPDKTQTPVPTELPDETQTPGPTDLPD